MYDIKSMTLSELTEYITSTGEKPFRAKQLYEWMHVHLAASYDDMTNLPKSMRERLEAEMPLVTLEVVEVQTSKLDGTQKYLFSLHDGEMIESVLMKYHHGNSVCISSQVGCKMGCRFCASTIAGFVRNLTPSEMLEQIYRIQRESKERVSNIVVMGCGEPLDNFDNLLRFIELISNDMGLNISQRNITVSTCGLVPRIKELSDKDLSITLALSLHAPDQTKRQKLMPVANTYEISETVRAMKEYESKTGRRVTFEYSLVAGENDSDKDAEELCALIGKRGMHVNLIPVNPIRERTFTPPDKRAVESFKNKLEKNGINVTIRREMGRDIDGACGMLRSRHLS